MPLAAIHGYTDVPALTTARFALHVAPQSVDVETSTRLRPPSTSSHTAARRLPPAFATTGKLVDVSAELAGPTTVLANVVPPLVERANFTPPVDVA